MIEKVERRAEVPAFDADVDREPRRMRRVLGNISLGEEFRFGDARIIGGLCAFIGVLRPGEESRDRAFRSVAVVDDEVEAAPMGERLRASQSLRRLSPQPALRLAVAGHRLAGEIIRARVADILLDPRRHVGQSNEAGRRSVGERGRGGESRGEAGQRQTKRCRQGRTPSPATLVKLHVEAYCARPRSRQASRMLLARLRR